MYPVIHIAIPSYALMAVLGGLAVLLFLYFRLDKFELPFLDFIRMFALCIVFGFLGSRIVYVGSRLSWLLSNFSVQHLISTIIGGGLVFYGGLLGVLFGIYVYCKKHQIDFLNVYNFIAPSIPLFHAFGRIGCFMSGCCYGLELKTPVIFLGFIQFNRIPTQLIEAAFEILLFAILFIWQCKNNKKDFLKIYMITYAVFRFLIEFFRGDDVRGFFFGFSTSQMISLGIIVWYIVLSMKKKCVQTAAS